MRRLVIYMSIGLATFSVGTNLARRFAAAGAPLQTAPKVEAQQKIQFVRLDEPISFEASRIQPAAAAAAAELVLDYDPQEFNPRGDYFILGKKPKGFREFDVLELAVETANDKAFGNALFVTRAGGRQNSNYTVSGRVTKTGLSLTAAPDSAEDFTYIFSGHFLKDNSFGAANKNSPVVQGKLIKLKNGIKVAETEVKLRVEYLGC